MLLRWKSLPTSALRGTNGSSRRCKSAIFHLSRPLSAVREFPLLQIGLLQKDSDQSHNYRTTPLYATLAEQKHTAVSSSVLFFFAHARLVLSKRVSTTKTTTLQSLSLCLGWCLYGLPANAKLTGGEENIKAASPQSGDDDVGRCESENRDRVGLG